MVETGWVGEDLRAIVEPGIELSPFKFFVAGDTGDIKPFAAKTALPARSLAVQHAANARICVGDAALFTEDGEVVEQTLYMTKKEDLKRPLPRPDNQPDLQGRPGIIAHNAGWRNYYHMLVQCCLSVWVFKRYFAHLDGRFLLPELTPTFKELVRLSGGEAHDTIYVHRNLDVLLPEAAFTSLTYGDYVYKPSSLLPLFAEDVFQRAGARIGAPRRFYISRRDSKNRVLVNEESLERRLAAAGFEIVQPSTMTPAEQMATFRAADMIVAPHGAGLANLIFCRPGTRVIELTPAGYQNQCFVRLAQVMQLDHEVHVFPSTFGSGSVHRNTWELDPAYVMAAL